MVVKFETEFNIGDHVYHIASESEKGVIIDITYSIRHNETRYAVVFGRLESDTVWCYEDELTEQINFR